MVTINHCPCFKREKMCFQKVKCGWNKRKNMSGFLMIHRFQKVYIQFPLLKYISPNSHLSPYVSLFIYNYVYIYIYIQKAILVGKGFLTSSVQNPYIYIPTKCQLCYHPIIFPWVFWGCSLNVWIIKLYPNLSHFFTGEVLPQQSSRRWQRSHAALRRRSARSQRPQRTAVTAGHRTLFISP